MIDVSPGLLQSAYRPGATAMSTRRTRADCVRSGTMKGRGGNDDRSLPAAVARRLEAHITGRALSRAVRAADAIELRLIEALTTKLSGGDPRSGASVRSDAELERGEAMMEEANEEYEERTAGRHETLLRDAARYRWLRCGGWEVLQNPKYWTPENKFDGAVDAAMLDVALNAAQERANAVMRHSTTTPRRRNERERR